VEKTRRGLEHYLLRESLLAACAFSCFCSH